MAGMKKTAPVAVMGDFEDPDALLKAAEKIANAGYTAFDIYTPYPVHGLDRAMKLPKTKLSFFSLLGGLAGFFVALLMIWWTGAVDYKLNIGGKPLFAFQFAVPVTFELTVLFCALTTFVVMLVLSKLPRWYSPYQHDKGFQRAVDDLFVVAIPSSDPRFILEDAKRLLENVGAKNVRVVED